MLAAKPFSADVQKMVQDLTCVSDLADLSKKVIKLEEGVLYGSGYW